MPTTLAIVPQDVLLCINRLIVREGGVADRGPVDRGGFTKAGITIPTWARYIGAPCTPKDLQAATPDQIVDCYYKLFWIGENADAVYRAHKAIGEFMFDWIVNSDRSGIKHFQTFLKVMPDGVIGQGTITRLAEMVRLSSDADRFILNALVDYRIEFYLHLCVGDPTQLGNIVGWFRRANSFRAYNSSK
jgi:lysozyme family protein